MQRRETTRVVSHEKVDLLQLAIVAAAAAIIQKRHRMFGRKSVDSSVFANFDEALMSATARDFKSATFGNSVIGLQ